MSHAYAPEEEASLRRALKEGGPLHCPRCGGPMRERRILPSPAVSYVRDRVLLECDACGRRTVVDR